MVSPARRRPRHSGNIRPNLRNAPRLGREFLLCPVQPCVLYRDEDRSLAPDSDLAALPEDFVALLHSKLGHAPFPWQVCNYVGWPASNFLSHYADHRATPQDDVDCFFNDTVSPEVYTTSASLSRRGALPPGHGS